MYQILVVLPSGPTRVLSSPLPLSVSQLRLKIATEIRIPENQQYLTTFAGRPLDASFPSFPGSQIQLENHLENHWENQLENEWNDAEDYAENYAEDFEEDDGEGCGFGVISNPRILEHGEIVRCNLRLVGGKGGFGSMLRSQGARMKAKGPTNQNSCRDLSGRRLKVVEDAKLLTDWQKQQFEAKKEKEEKINRKIQQALKEEEPPKRQIPLDSSFLTESENVIERVGGSVFQGLEESKKSEEIQRKLRVEAAKVAEKASKKLSHWDADADLMSTDDDEEEEEDKKGNEMAASSSKQVPTQQEKGVIKPVAAVVMEEKAPTKVEAPTLVSLTKATVEEPQIDHTSSSSSSSSTLPSKSSHEESTKKPEVVFDHVEMSKYESAKDLEILGLDHLKAELTRLGMKAGGSLKERAERLFLIKTTKLEDLPGKVLQGKK